MSNPQMMITMEQAVWAYIEAGRKKHQTEIGIRITKAFLAGVCLSLGSTVMDIISSDPWYSNNAPGLLKVMQGLVFPIGLIMIVLLQFDLVTPQMAIVIASTMKRKIPLWSFLVDIPLVFIFNLAGSLAYGGIIVHYGNVFDTPELQQGAVMLAESKIITSNFREILLGAIGCNFCVCSAVFMSSLAKDLVSKVVAAYCPVFIFVTCGYNHIVANMFFIPIALMTGQANFSVGTYIWKSMIATLLGNIIGAACFICPLVYIHGRDEFSPDNLYVTEIGETSKTTFAAPQQKSAGWKNDIERSAVI